MVNVDLIQTIDFIKNLIQEQPPCIGLSLVSYRDKSELNHIRVINNGLTTIHGFRLFLKTRSDTKHTVKYLSRTDKDVFGNSVKYEIEIPKDGIYLRPNNPAYIMFSSMSDLDDQQLSSARFTYINTKGKRKSVSDCPIPRVSASIT